MMMAPEQLKQFLCHSDEGVRALAADYFSDGWSRDPEILPLVLDARERYGDELFLRNLTRARHLVLNASSLDRLLLELDRADNPRVIVELSRLIEKAPTELLFERRGAIATHSKLDPEIFSNINRRWTYREWESEALWEELLKDARERDDREAKGIDGDLDPADVSDQLIEVLTERNLPDAETIHRLLADPQIEGSWLEIDLAALAGKRRIREAIPWLVENCRDEDAELLMEESTEALARIGDVSTVRLLLESYDSGDWSFKFTAATILGHLKFPECESAVLELLKSEQEDDLRTRLCGSLCELISEQAVDQVRKEIASGSRMAFRETAPLALAVATILGQELPGVAVQWQREVKRQQEALMKLQTDWEKDHDEDSLEFASGMNENFESSPHPTSTQPIRNDGHRVGRNDPCPCGSGKKYKKCCGANRG